MATLKSLFKADDGSPLVLTEGQQQIFDIIVNREPKRNIINCCTQYGKSMTVALGLIIRATMFPEKWAIVAPSEKKAKIIMNYVIQHLFDNPVFFKQLETDTSLEKLRRERSKERLTFKGGGEIFLATGDSRNRQRVKEALMGFGAPNLVLDESSLVQDDLYATAKRMVGGSKDNFILEIGNPFNRNHFYRTWHTDSYNQVMIDYHQALKEGRYNEEFIEEMRKEAFFSVLYGCEFPEEDEIDERGYHMLTTNLTVNIVESAELGDNLRLGVDVSEGGDDNAFVLRGDKGAKLLSTNKSSDLMTQVVEVKKYKEQFKLESANIFIDDTGVGAGVTDRLKELKIEVTGVKVGMAAHDSQRYANRKAEQFWAVKQWLEGGGKLEKHEGWMQFNEIKYKENSSGKVKMESKDELRRRGVASPDIADALMLTFSKKVEPSISVF